MKTGENLGESKKLMQPNIRNFNVCLMLLYNARQTGNSRMESRAASHRISPKTLGIPFRANRRWSSTPPWIQRGMWWRR